MLPAIPKVSSLCKRSSCETLSNAFEMSKKLSLLVIDCYQNQYIYYQQSIEIDFNKNCLEEKNIDLVWVIYIPQGNLNLIKY